MSTCNDLDDSLMVDRMASNSEAGFGGSLDHGQDKITKNTACGVIVNELLVRQLS